VHRRLAEEKLAGLATDLARAVGSVERTPIMEGRQMIMILTPTKTRLVGTGA